jgi:ribose 5-phosphate isomerase B
MIDQPGDVELGADVEIWVVEIDEEEKQVAAGPIRDVKISRHGPDCIPTIHEITLTTSPGIRDIWCDFVDRVPSTSANSIVFGGEEVMKIALASDHAGFSAKEKIKPVLEDLGIEFEDLGTESEDSVDYPDYARKVAEQVAGGRVDQGLLVCGSGTGMAITANKVPGVRAAVAWSEEIARLAREHNNANVLAIGARTTPPGQIPAIVRAWFNTQFAGGRHAERVAKIEKQA